MTPEVVRTRGEFTQETLKLMQGLVDTWCIHPVMVQGSRLIVRGSQGPVAEARAVWQWVRDHVAYRLDPVGAEWVQDPFETMAIERAGDCDDMAVLCGTLLQALGHPCLMAAIAWKGQSDYSHAVCRDELAKVIVDPVPGAVFGDASLPGRIGSLLVAR